MSLQVIHTTVVLCKIFLAFILLRTAYEGVKRIVRRFLVPSTLQNVPGPPPESWFKGNLGQLFNSKGLKFHHQLAERYGGMVKVHGFFGDEQLYISDPDALRSILLKDQEAFEETSVFLETNRIIFGPGLVSTKGEQHRRQRKITAPIFSVAQLRAILPTFYEIAEKLAQVFTNELPRNDAKSQRILDISEWMSRVALEAVGRTVLGYSFDPLDSAHNNPYTSAVKELVPTIFSVSLIRQFAPFLVRMGPPWLRRKLVEWTPIPVVQKLKNMADVMDQKAKEILKAKINQVEYLEEMNSIPEGPKDIISALVQRNNSLEKEEKMSDEELTGQLTVLVFGAQDTTSSALSRILWLLATNPDIQEKIRQEITASDQAGPNRDNEHRLSYDEITQLPWLDAVVKETLRLYPPVPFVRRTATRDCILPYKQNSESRQLMVPSGTTVFLGIATSNRLESLWGSDARKWKPERWLHDSGYKAGEMLPGIYSGLLSFLGGGRSCIGYRFALVEMKVILVTLLTRFKFNRTGDSIVWNLSSIISPSVRVTRAGAEGTMVEERKGLPLLVERIA